MIRIYNFDIALVDGVLWGINKLQMDKNEGKHHICSCFPNAFIWLLTSILLLFPNIGMMKSHTQKRICLGAASCPWKVKQCPLCKSEERRKTIVSKLLGLGSSLLALRGDVSKTKCIELWCPQHSCHSASKEICLCSTCSFLFPDCSVSNLQSPPLPWIVWERHKVSDVISVQTSFVNVVLLWATFYSPWDKSFETSLQSSWVHRVWKLCGLWAKVTDRNKECIWMCSGLCILLRNLVCSTNILGVLGSIYFLPFWSMFNLFHKYLYGFF